jgi:BetI-type transcriptional repressor, C-terminal
MQTTSNRAQLVRASVQRSLEQVLPLDAERQTEMEIWLAFTARGAGRRGTM